MTTPHDHPNHAAHGPTSALGSLRCPECGEPARPVPPREWPLDGFAARPAVSHRDGTALCPVPGPDGSRPAEPVGVPERAEPRRTAPVPRPTDDPRVYMVAGGDMVVLFDSAEEADIMAVTMTAANLEPVTLPLSEAQWEQAHAVLRSQQPHITVTDARSARAADAS